VNGGLFAKKHSTLKFSLKSRKMMLESGALDWSKINPDIFGSMIQAVVHPEQRGGLGMHYTSVPNIMKVIEPLFLNEIRDEFKINFNNAASTSHKFVSNFRTRGIPKGHPYSTVLISSPIITLSSLQSSFNHLHIY